jgi:hypothetical protein
VIRGYLNGKTRDQIALDAGISAGMASSIIKDWKKRIGAPDIEEVRDFSITVRKYGMSVNQCAQGFRTLQLLKSLDIGDGNDRGDGDDDTIEITSFIEAIRMHCKNLGVTPAIALLWIKDLLDCNLYPNERGTGASKGTLPKNPTSTPHRDKTDSGSQTEQGFSPFPQIKVPFISQVSNLITQKRKECVKLEDYRKKINEETEKAVFQRGLSEKRLAKTNRVERDAMSYLRMFSELKSLLFDCYGIDTKEGLKGLAKLIYDFKVNGYDPAKIIYEYTSSLSLRLEIKENENRIKGLCQQRNSLQNLVLSLDSQVSMHRQTMNVFRELEAIGFGLADLKQIWYTILEISNIKKITSKEAVACFIKDVEEQYYSKLSFEDMVKEERDDLHQLKKKVHEHRQILQCQPFIGSTLQSLFQNGVSEQDIVVINQLARLQNNTFFDNVYPAAPNDKDKGSNLNGRSEFWKSLIGELKRYGGIKFAIREQSEKLDLINREIKDSNKQRQEILVYCQLTVSFINILNNKISYFKGLVDHHFNKHIYNTAETTSSSFIPSPILIFLIYNKSDNKGQGEEK